MTSIPSWELLSVQAFFRQANWSGQLPARSAEGESRPAPHRTQPVSRGSVTPLQSWPTLTIKEFFTHNNWTGLSLVTLSEQSATPAQPIQPLNGTSVSQEEFIWPCLSVKSFFARCNWHGQTPQASAASDRDDASPLVWSVAQFMASISWEGYPAIAALPEREPIPASTPDRITLTDLSNLF